VIKSFRDGQEVRQGSGFLVSPDGKLVTNRHVLEDADALQVELSTGEIYDNVFVVSDDVRRDLTVLRIPVSNVAHLTIGDEREVAVGDPVYAMGSPRGWEGTFTSGLVSATRLIGGVSLLQISAPISPGSSGGPVFNSAGQVIGVATFIIEDAQNLNMAVPARYAQGMLAVAERPRPFSELVAAFVTEESEVGTTTVRAADSELEPWAQVLAAEIRRVRTNADSLNLIETHDAYIEILKQGVVHEIEYTYDKRGDMVNIAGVCDVDCSDLDIGVYDGSGKEIVIDTEDDDRPVVRFRVVSPGTFKVRVLVSKCSTTRCAFGLLSFVEPR
jgi:S1-C subfamily serine protease